MLDDDPPRFLLHHIGISDFGETPLPRLKFMVVHMLHLPSMGTDHHREPLFFVFGIPEESCPPTTKCHERSSLPEAHDD